MFDTDIDRSPASILRDVELLLSHWKGIGNCRWYQHCPSPYSVSDSRSRRIPSLLAPRHPLSCLWALTSVSFSTAVIVGGVVGALFAAFLVTLLIYRMKKKDEGSYTLEEPKQASVTYQKPDKQEEFYA